MNIKHIAFGVIAAVALCSCQRATVYNGSALTETYPKEQAEVESTLRAVLGSAEAKDLAAVDSYHLYGPKFTKFDDWEPLTRQDAAAARKGESEGLTAATSFKANVEDLKVDVFGNVAIATFVLNYTIESAGTATATRARSTVAFARDETGWKIIHEHHSAFKSNP